MPTRDTAWPAGTPNWIDIAVPDVEAALAFYGPVLGWSFVDTGPDFGNYQMCRVGDRNAAGIGPQQSPDQPNAPYLDAVVAYDGGAEELMSRGYEDAYRQFIEPVVGASGEGVGSALEDKRIRG